MKVFNGSNQGISVSMDSPYPRIIMGQGGHKRATWIPIGKHDANKVIEKKFLPCPHQGKSDHSALPDTCSANHVCESCGKEYGEWKLDDGLYYRYHPESGEILSSAVIKNVGIIKTEKGMHLIVAPKEDDNRALILWSVSSGYRGSASISANEGVKVIATDESWHSGRGNLGSTAEMLAILEPGQQLIASRSGRRVQGTRGILTYDGENVTVVFGGNEIFAATSEEVVGEYL
ncbi:MAG: hypothetical protein WC435_00365 [Candidatus Paceibacterota bacterium]